MDSFLNGSQCIGMYSNGVHWVSVRVPVFDKNITAKCKILAIRSTGTPEGNSITHVIGRYVDFTSVHKLPTREVSLM